MELPRTVTSSSISDWLKEDILPNMRARLIAMNLHENLKQDVDCSPLQEAKLVPR